MTNAERVKEFKKEKNAYRFLIDLGYSLILKLGGSNFLMKKV